MTALPRIAWTERSGPGHRLLLVVDLQPIAGVALGTILIGAPFLAQPLGRLSSPFAMLMTLPPLALALEAFGWRDRLASWMRRIKGPMSRLMATYGVWLLTSALLTLDVAAVAAASIGIAAAGDHHEERRWQLGGAILGANVGSLLLPFSNLTNLMLVSATGIGLAAYVGLAVWPQLATALAVGMLFAVRARQPIYRSGSDVDLPEIARAGDRSKPSDPAAGVAGGLAVIGALAAVAFGLAGGDVAVPFAMSAGLLVGAAVVTGRLHVRDLFRSVPLGGLAIIGFAAAANGPMQLLAGLLPRPDASLAGLLLSLGVGSGLAVVVTNLPAAAFGATWLAQAHPGSIIAFLIGTNVAALASPHGSVATILARAIGSRHGVSTEVRAYLGSAWKYALVGTIAATLALVLSNRS